MLMGKSSKLTCRYLRFYGPKSPNIFSKFVLLFAPRHATEKILLQRRHIQTKLKQNLTFGHTRSSATFFEIQGKFRMQKNQLLVSLREQHRKI